MTADMVARTIQLILAPVVMVSACGLVINGVLARYAAVNDRLRSLVRERWEAWRALSEPEGASPASRLLASEVVARIDAQAPGLLRHHKLLHDAVVAVYLAMLLFVACMFVIAVAALTGQDWLSSAALLVFLAGTAALLVGVLLTGLEVRTSHEAVHFEVRRSLQQAPASLVERHPHEEG